MLIKIFHGYSYFIFFYFLMINVTYILLILSSLKRLREFVRFSSSDPYVPTDYTRPISILVPAYNEQETIIDSVNSLLEMDYPLYEIIVINDGSKDETLQRLIKTFGLRRIDLQANEQLATQPLRGFYSSFERPNLVVVDKENGGKADALNAGINVSRYPLYCAVDADSVIEKSALLRLVRPFLQDEKTVAVGGMVRIANGCELVSGQVQNACVPRSPILVFQIIEYLRAFLTNRIGWETINSLVIISGAFGLFEKSVVIQVGGYYRTIGEDMELTVRMHEYLRRKKQPYKVDFASDAVCWTQAPEQRKGLAGQRVRWHSGLIDSLWSHRNMLLNPRYGTVGMLGLPYFWFVEMLGPVIEGLGYIFLVLAWALGILSNFFLFVFAMAFLYGLFFSLSAILLEEISYRRYRKTSEIIRLIFYALIEQVVYRPITVFWRIKAFVNYRKGKHKWGEIERKSFSNPNDPVSQSLT